MTPTEYTVAALRTSPHPEYLSTNGRQRMFLLGALGLTGEAGEVAEHIKKYVFHGHPLDTEFVVKELGDVLWYLAFLADTCGVPLEAVMAQNIAKLEARYPEGHFSVERSQHRSPSDV
jgi:NTP pyrophosphatase (non-canonical NTP hydrolase)